MAAALVGSAPRYQAAAADTKPTTGVAAGALLDETDTGDRYLYTGAAWVRLPWAPEGERWP